MALIVETLPFAQSQRRHRPCTSLGDIHSWLLVMPCVQKALTLHKDDCKGTVETLIAD